MGGQLLYELHVSRYVFLAIILQKCVSEIFSVHGRSLCPTLHLAAGTWVEEFTKGGEQLASDPAHHVPRGLQDAP